MLCSRNPFCEFASPVSLQVGAVTTGARRAGQWIHLTHPWDANKVSSLEIKCHPEQSGSGLVRPLEPPMIAACKAAIREEISKVNRNQRLTISGKDDTLFAWLRVFPTI